MVISTSKKWAVVVLTTLPLALSACNLGQNNVPEPVPGAQEAAPVEGVTPAVEDQGATGETVEEAAPEVQLPATNTPTGELLPQETLGPITIDNNAELRTQEPVTVRVQRGTQVSDVTCSWTISGGATQALGTPTTSQLDDPNLQQDVYTFTPAAEGSYVVSCQGTALTAAGTRSVSATSASFAVEAKG